MSKYSNMKTLHEFMKTKPELFLKLYKESEEEE